MLSTGSEANHESRTSRNSDMLTNGIIRGSRGTKVLRLKATECAWDLQGTYYDCRK